jgi:hypothetical protein
MSNIEEDTKIGVLYNDCYGGFNISEKAFEIYNEKTKKGKLNSMSFVCRHNPLLIEILNEIGEKEFSGDCAAIKVKYIDNKYKNFYNIEEYDGLEDVEIMHDSYNLYLINTIAFDITITNDEKIEKIKGIFNA